MPLMTPVIGSNVLEWASAQLALFWFPVILRQKKKENLFQSTGMLSLAFYDSIVSFFYTLHQ